MRFKIGCRTQNGFKIENTIEIRMEIPFGSSVFKAMDYALNELKESIELQEKQPAKTSKKATK